MEKITHVVRFVIVDGKPTREIWDKGNWKTIRHLAIEHDCPRSTMSHRVRHNKPLGGGRAKVWVSGGPRDGGYMTRNELAAIYKCSVRCISKHTVDLSTPGERLYKFTHFIKGCRPDGLRYNGTMTGVQSARVYGRICRTSPGGCRVRQHKVVHSDQPHLLASA